MESLYRFDFGRKRRLIGIHQRFNQDRTFDGHRLIENSAAVGRVLNSETSNTEAPGDSSKIDWLEGTFILLVAQENHLLPLDLAQSVVLDDDDFDGQLIPDAGGQFAQQHGEA